MTTEPLYRRIAETLRRSIGAGALMPGDRVISARRLAAREGVSLPTAVEALRLVESEGLIRARPRSGWFVAAPPGIGPGATRTAANPRPVELAGLVRRIFADDRAPLVPLGAAVPDPSFLPVDDLRRRLAATARRLGSAAEGYSLPPGRLDLRRRIALSAAAAGCPLDPAEIVVTTGATQAVHLALAATTRPGDVVAVESPTYFGTLLALERLGLSALEIATDPATGIDVDALERAIGAHRPAAIVVSPTVQNPTGAIMPMDARRRLADLAARHRIPVIEDDVYGDLAEEPRPAPLKALDRDGGIILCSSVSKTTAPGWRIGWIAAGRFRDAVLDARFADSWSGNPLTEAALAAHLASGDHERHLRRLRTAIAGSRRAMAARVEAAFPQGTRVGNPAAGFLLWVELPEGVDGWALHERALAAGIGVAPGRLFSTGDDFGRHLRLNAANPVVPRVLEAIDRLGRMAHEIGGRGEGPRR